MSKYIYCIKSYYLLQQSAIVGAESHPECLILPNDSLSYEPDLCSTVRVLRQEIVSIQQFDAIETQATACVHTPFVRSQHIPHILMPRIRALKGQHPKILRDHLSLRFRYDALLYLCSSYGIVISKKVLKSE